MKSLGIIPARYASSRFPAKVLFEIKGKTMLQRVWEQAQKSLLDEVIIGTDHNKIYEHALSFGAKVELTSREHQTGTDRWAEVWSKIEASATSRHTDIIVNLQADEPFIKPEQINSLLNACEYTKTADIVTLAKRIQSLEDLLNPNIVKVLFNEDSTSALQNAIYFSRHPIPFISGVSQKTWLNHFPFYKHIGLYAFQSTIFKQLSQLKQHRIERAESLEQLRWLVNGYKIAVLKTSWETLGIDTVEDLKQLNQFL